jgi:hypothetical protein
VLFLRISKKFEKIQKKACPESAEGSLFVRFSPIFDGFSLILRSFYAVSRPKIILKNQLF